MYEGPTPEGLLWEVSSGKATPQREALRSSRYGNLGWEPGPGNYKDICLEFMREKLKWENQYKLWEWNTYLTE